MIPALISGFTLGLSLILAIGAQNAFLLKQGIRREHVFVICVIFALSDVMLIFAGVFGFGILIAKFSWIKDVAILGGFIFLVTYGLKSFYSAYKLKDGLTPDDMPPLSFSKVIFLCLAFTWLNPHVYLDTMVLLGSVSVKFGELSWAFGVGAATASAVFFFTLGYASRLLALFFKQVLAWKILEIIIGFVMLTLAFMLILEF